MELQHPVDMAVFEDTIFRDCPIKLWWAHMTPWFNRYGTDEKTWYYVPFNITVTHYDCANFDTYTKEQHCQQISHDICHVLDLFLHGKHNRLLEREMGYGKPQDTDWTLKAWKNETRVLAMQSVLLGESFPCGYHYKNVALDLFKRVKSEEIAKLNPFQNEEIQVEIFNQCKTGVLVIKDAYYRMCHWIRNHEYFAKQNA